MASSSTINLEAFTWEYDVFLSFRGEDTRKDFTDHLYFALCQNRIRTFRDEEELKKGEYLGPELTRAIQSSRISMVVFSKDYASSRWCLDELEQIVECKETRKQIIFPIFYDVDPSEVRKQSGNYGLALAKHEERFEGSDKVHKWRCALTKVANMSGWDLQGMANGYESKFIDGIIQEVLLIVSQVPMFVEKHVVGLELHVNRLVKLMYGTHDDNNVRMIGIYGMTGIGKTLLAQTLYNKFFGHFKWSCFLEISSGILEIKRFQEEFLSKLLRRKIEVGSEGEGKALIKHWLQAKKCLIVLDNLEHLNQFEALCGERDWFGKGSRLILTTRDAHVFKELKEDEHYKVGPLCHNDSLELFSLHAFSGRLKPKEDYAKVLDGIVAYCGGLPLALKVLGAYLSDKSIEEWISAFDKLKEIPNNDVQAKLKISYDGLPDDRIKSLFLDLVCFSREISKETIDAMGYFSTIEIRNLVDKCLIDYCQWDGIGLHSLVREMGREIIRLESPEKPCERSRLWCPNDIHDVLIGQKGTEKIEVIVFNDSSTKDMKYNTKAFKNMENLRFLHIDGVYIDGKFKHLSKVLKYLRWNQCPLKYITIPLNCFFEKLVSLEMVESNIKEFKAPLKYFPHLESLNLNSCEHLTSTPNFSGAQNLRKLTFVGCYNLVKVHSSIGDLGRLLYLDFSCCDKLKKLPNSLCKLSSLQHLVAAYALKLKELPEDFGNLTSLEDLYLFHTNIPRLPSNLSHLFRLESICLNYCESLEIIQELPPNIRDIELRNCKNLKTISQLPPNLESITLLCCNNLKMLPKLPHKLRDLDAKNCESMEIVPNLSNCTELKKLYLSGCSKLQEIQGWENLHLRQMQLIRVPHINYFSESIKKVLIGSKPDSYFECIVTTNELPRWMTCKEEGSSISFQWPLHNMERGFVGFFFWIVWEAHSLPPGLTRHYYFTIETSGFKTLWFSKYNFIAEVGEFSTLNLIPWSDPKFDGLEDIKVGEVIKVTPKAITDIQEYAEVMKIGVEALYTDRDGFLQFAPITKVG